MEERIKELEDQVTVLLTSSASGTASSHSSPSVTTGHDLQASNRKDDPNTARSFKGLKLDDKGAITYHGATSFFHLPSEHDDFAVEDIVTPIDSDCQRRERLVSNAWEQRALENLSDIPVRTDDPKSVAAEMTYTSSRNRTSISLMCTGTGLTLFSTSYTGPRSLVSLR